MREYAYGYFPPPGEKPPCWTLGGGAGHHTSSAGLSRRQAPRKAVVAARQQPGFGDKTTSLDREPHDRIAAVASNPPATQSKVDGIQPQMVPEGHNGRLVTNDQNIVQTYTKNVLLSLAFLPTPLIFAVAPSNLVQRVYCRPIRKFSHGQNAGPPWLNGR